jgi:hypothetical protein
LIHLGKPLIEVSRRRFFGFLAAPAIVHAANLMPIKAPPLARSVDWRPLVNPGLHERELALGYTITRKAIDENLYRRQFDLERSFLRTKEYFAASILAPEAFPIDTDVLTLS